MELGWLLTKEIFLNAKEDQRLLHFILVVKKSFYEALEHKLSMTHSRNSHENRKHLKRQMKWLTKEHTEKVISHLKAKKEACPFVAAKWFSDLLFGQWKPD